MFSQGTRRVLRLLPEKVNRCSRLSFSSKSDKGSVGDYFSSLRWQAANALTSNLPEEERNILLDKLAKDGNLAIQDSIDDDSDDEDSATSYEPSIDEAIAATKMQEAERYEQKWERDKEELIAEAEEAARARIESDIEIQRRQIAFEEWKASLEREKEQPDSTTEELGDHPILGPIVADLGYKRIHLASATNLATIPIWKKQRIYRHGRSKNMANEKLKTLSLGLPGVIGIFEKTDGSLNIIDGQHRIGMLKMLKKKVTEDDAFDFENVLVEVYPAQEEQKQDSQVQDLFFEVNKAEPVKLVDMPGVAKAKDRKIITEVAESLRQKYPDMFSESQRCRSPHLNVDNLRDALFASKIIEKHSLKTSKAMEEWILQKNEMLEIEFQDEANQKLANANALKKANRLKFYLGLDSSWLYK